MHTSDPIRPEDPVTKIFMIGLGEKVIYVSPFYLPKSRPPKILLLETKESAKIEMLLLIEFIFGAICREF